MLRSGRDHLRTPDYDDGEGSEGIVDSEKDGRWCGGRKTRSSGSKAADRSDSEIRGFWAYPRIGRAIGIGCLVWSESWVVEVIEETGASKAPAI